MVSSEHRLYRVQTFQVHVEPIPSATVPIPFRIEFRSPQLRFYAERTLPQVHKFHASWRKTYPTLAKIPRPEKAVLDIMKKQAASANDLAMKIKEYFWIIFQISCTRALLLEWLKLPERSKIRFTANAARQESWVLDQAKTQVSPGRMKKSSQYLIKIDGTAGTTTKGAIPIIRKSKKKKEGKIKKGNTDKACLNAERIRERFQNNHKDLITKVIIDAEKSKRKGCRRDEHKHLRKNASQRDFGDKKKRAPVRPPERAIPSNNSSEMENSPRSRKAKRHNDSTADVNTTKHRGMSLLSKKHASKPSRPRRKPPPPIQRTVAGNTEAETNFVQENLRNIDQSRPAGKFLEQPPAPPRRPPPPFPQRLIQNTERTPSLQKGSFDEENAMRNELPGEHRRSEVASARDANKFCHVLSSKPTPPNVPPPGWKPPAGWRPPADFTPSSFQWKKLLSDHGFV